MEIVINGVKTHYQVLGDGKPFLILHGWGSDSQRWQTVAEEIAKSGYKVYVPDLPGFGESDPLTEAWDGNKYIAWIEEFLRELDIKEFYLLGHSFGGALACKTAIKHPQRVSKLFLVSCALVRKKTNKKTVFKYMAKTVKPFSFMPWYPLLRKVIYKYIIRRSDYTFVDGVMKQTYLNVIAEDLSQFSGFIKVPTIIIWGDKDKFTPIEDAHFLNQRIKNSKLIFIEGAGHDLNRKQPEILSEKVLGNIN